MFRAFLFAYGGIKAARVIHKRLLTSILAAPISFFDVTPVSEEGALAHWESRVVRKEKPLSR